MIFPPIELPQYIVVPPTDCEMKDIIGYHNKHLTGKISNYTAFFEKCGYLLSAIYRRWTILPNEWDSHFIPQSTHFIFRLHFALCSLSSVLYPSKKRYRLAGVKCQGLTQGNQVSLFIGDLDVVACCFAGLAHPACFCS